MNELDQKTDILREPMKPATGFISVLLLLSLIALSERILYDLTRFFSNNSQLFDSYFDNLQTIMIHAAVIIPVLIVSIIVNATVEEKKRKYAVVLIPYFGTTIMLAIQLSLQVGVYFYNHHTQFEFYLVMSLLVLITSVAIYIIQDRYAKRPS